MDKFANSEKEMVRTKFVVDEKIIVESEPTTESQKASDNTNIKETTDAGQKSELSVSTALENAIAESNQEYLESIENIERVEAPTTDVFASAISKHALLIFGIIIISFCLFQIAPAYRLLASACASIPMIVGMVFASLWATKTEDRLDGLAGKNGKMRLLNRIGALSPIAILWLFSLTFKTCQTIDPEWYIHQNNPIYPLLTALAMGPMLLFVLQIPVRLLWLFRYPQKIYKALKEQNVLNPDSPKTELLMAGLFTGILLIDLLPFLLALFLFLPLNANMVIFSLAIALQAFVFGFINKKLGHLERIQSKGKKLAALVRAQDGYNLDEEMIGYKPMASTERWMKQRFSHGSVWKPILLALMVGGILLLNPGQRLEELLSHIFNSPTVKLPGVGGGALSALFNFNQIFVTCFGGFFISLVTGLGVYLLRLPTAIISGPRGLRFLYHSFTGREDRGINWSELTEIKLERKLNSASTLSDCLLFKTPKKTVKLKLDNFKTGQDKEKLLHAIESFAPSVPRDAAIMEVLALPADHSYTEVWMTALSAPPKRERLKPLTADAVMNEGNYTVVKELGSGGQGFAYLAKDKEDKEVVLKEFVLPIYVDIQARRKALERFENEARLLSRLDNPQVVKLRGFFIEDHRAYLVLEHIDGKNLRQIVAEKGHFSEEETKVLLAKMCKILSYLHSLEPPLVHRDFTPDNLILDKDGNLKLIDFNVAQEMQDGTTGTVVGKQAYLPPEQFRGQAEPASDVYAMGATLYYLLTGKDPTPISTLRVAKELPDLDPQLDQLMTQLTSMDPALRPTADEVLKGQEQAKAED